jgi:ribose-phosphate pyrophosphokinase
MVRNIVVLSGSSHPGFVDSVCEILGVSPSSRLLAKFSSGETRCEIRDSVRGKDVYIVQTFGVGPTSSASPPSSASTRSATTADEEGRPPPNTVNDYFIELCIMISACKTGSARRVTAVLPLFPYSRQPDLAFSKAGAPLVSMSGTTRQVVGERGPGTGAGGDYTFESVPVTPGASIPRTAGLGSAGVDVAEMMGKVSLGGGNKGAGPLTGGNGTASPVLVPQQQPGTYTTHDYENPGLMIALQAKSGYKQWMAQSGSLVADLLTCAGADRVLTCDLHESAYQGFFDIPGEFCFPRYCCPWALEVNQSVADC